jgi:adenylate kinase
MSTITATAPPYTTRHTNTIGMLNIVLFGPPGAGKGTQSQKLIQRYGLTHLSTGDLLRSQIAAGTPLGLKAKSLMDNGLLVPDEVVIGMIESQLKENPDSKGFIFDGFPRTVPQAQALDQLLEDHNTQVTCMIALNVDEAELIKRLLLRGQTSGRPDDQNEALISKRVVEYNTKTAVVAQYYQEQGKLTSVNGVGEMDQIFNTICKAITAAA